MFLFLPDLPSVGEGGGSSSLKACRERKHLALVCPHCHLLRCTLSCLDLRCITIHVTVVPCSQWHMFLRSPSLSNFCIPSGHMRAGGGPLCLPNGSVQGSLLPLGPFWTHIKLFCYSQPLAGVRGNYVGCLRSSCPVLLIAFSFLKEMTGSCCFPGSS